MADNDDGPKALADEVTALDNGYAMAWCIDADGTPWPWIIAPLCADHQDDHVRHGCTCRNCAPHEQPGPLPASVRARLERERCGAPRADGHPCRTAVGSPGGRCAWHRQEATA